MKTSLFALALALLFFSCKSEVRDDSKNPPVDETAVESEEETVEEEVSKDKEYVFLSKDMEVDEYLKLIEKEDGVREWYYWSAKNTKEVRLGSKKVDGFENIYFFSKPDELYEIGGSECGFSLLQDKEILQWYGQIEPECTLEDYGY